MDPKTIPFHDNDQDDQLSNPSITNEPDQTQDNMTPLIRDQYPDTGSSLHDEQAGIKTEGRTVQPRMDRPLQKPVVDESALHDTHQSTGNITHLWLAREDVEELRSHWDAIQVQFVDSPCSAVEQGDALVAETVERIKQAISGQQNNLNQQWLNHDDITTEELRITLQNYRTFLNHLLNL